MSVTIRLCTPQDYPALVALQARAYCDAQGQPLAPMSVEDMEAYDRERAAHIRFGRWVAESNGQIAGWCEHDQTAYRYHPQKFWVDGYVDPNYQRQGIGSALYNHLMAALRPFQPIAVRNAVREDLTHSIAFLQRRGWEVALRTWPSALDVSAFDPTPFRAVEAQVKAQGIEIQTLPELQNDPERERKLYELVWQIRQDLPDLDAATMEPFEIYVKERLHHPDIPADGYFVAVHEGNYVGYLYHKTIQQEPSAVRIAQLGVLRSHRGRGIATALKLRGNAYAKEHGFSTIRTTNESNNEPVLRINTRMGFVRQPAYLHMLKTFDAEPLQA